MHPAVADVGVLGTPDPDMGEQVTAFVQLADGAVGHRGRAHRLVPRAPQPLQVPARGPLRRRRSPAPHRQAPQAPPADESVSSRASRTRTDWSGAVSPSWRRMSASNSAMPAPTAASLSSVNLGKPASRSASHSSAKAPLLMPSTICLHRAGDVEVGELGHAAQLAVLARRRVVLHLGGVALEAQQPVGALDLAATGTAR